MRALSGGRSSTTRLINNGGGGASGALSAPSSWTRPLLRLRGRSIAAAAVALGGGGGGAGVGGVGGSVAPSSALLLLRSRLAVSAAVVVAATAGGAADEPDDFAQLEKTQQQQQERGQQPTDAAARDVAGDGDGASRPRRTSSSSDNSNTNSNSNSNNSSNEKNSNSFFSFLKDFGSPARRCTDVILVATVLGFAAQWLTRGAITSWGAKVNDLVWPGGQWWRLLTPSLLHAGALHLLINSHALWTLGPHLEAVAGGPRLCATYAASAVTGTALSVLLTPAPSVGASGAFVFPFCFVLFVLSRWARRLSIFWVGAPFFGSGLHFLGRGSIFWVGAPFFGLGSFAKGRPRPLRPLSS